MVTEDSSDGAGVEASIRYLWTFAKLFCITLSGSDMGHSASHPGTVGRVVPSCRFVRVLGINSLPPICTTLCMYALNSDNAAFGIKLPVNVLITWCYWCNVYSIDTILDWILKLG